MVRRADETERHEPLDRLAAEALLGAGLAHVTPPILLEALDELSGVRFERRPAERRQVAAAAGTRRQELGHQQGQVAVGALLGHAQVGQVAPFVDHGDAFAAHLGDESGGLGDLGQDEGPLQAQVGGLVLVQARVFDERVVEQPPGQPRAQAAVPGLVGVGRGLFDHLGEALVEVLGLDRRRATPDVEHRRQGRTVDVVEHVAPLVFQVLAFVAVEASQHPQIEQQTHDLHQVAPLVVAHHVEAEPRPGELRVGCRQVQDLVGEPAEGGLAVGGLQGGEGQAEQDVASLRERFLGLGLERAAGAVGQGAVSQGARRLAQARELARDGEGPARVARQPLAQPAGMTAHEVELRRFGRQQRALQQGPQGRAPLLQRLLVELGGQPRGFSTVHDAC